MTYDRLLALDENVNRRLTVAQKSKETSPDALFKSLQTTAYRSKKKRKKKKDNNKTKETKETTEEEQKKGGEEEEEDECAICLEIFKHRETMKRFPCGHCLYHRRLGGCPGSRIVRRQF